MSFSEWKEVTLAEISKGGKGNYGIAASAVEYSKDLLTYLRITDISDDGTLNKEGLKSVDDENAEKYLLKPNDIVFARTGNSTGRSYFYDGSDGELVFAGFLIKFSLDQEKVNPKFMRYYTLSSNYRNWISSFSTGSTRKNINAKTYAGMTINLPPRKQQDYLVNILSILDEKIEVNNQINKTLEEMAQTIFKHWFVDFEFPNEEGKPYKSSGGEMVESELGLIPKGWEVVEFRELFKFIKGKKPKVIDADKFENSKKYLTIDVLNRKSILFASKEKTIGANNNDVLMVMDGASSGTIYFGQEGIVASTLAKLDLINNRVSNQFLFYMVKFFENDIKSHTTGSAIPHADKEFTYRIKIALPKDISIQIRANKILSNISDTFIMREQENAILKNIRDTLLPKLMSGEIRVPLDKEGDE